MTHLAAIHKTIYAEPATNFKTVDRSSQPRLVRAEVQAARFLEEEADRRDQARGLEAVPSC